MPDVFWLTRLHPGADRAAYADFVRRADYARVRTYPAVQHYRVHMIEGGLGGEPNPVEWDCIEHFRVSDVAAYQRDREAAPGREAFRKELYTYLKLAIPLRVTTIEP